MNISGEIYDLLENYLSGRFMRVALMEKILHGNQFLLELPKIQFWNHIFFLVYINDLPNK